MKGRVCAVLVAACVALAGCAGSSTDQANPALAESLAPEAPEAEGAQTPETAATPDASTDATTTSEVRRELGLALRPESDVATNLLPPVEVHDVGQDRMVNFKNIFPAEKPVLLWMWAPF